MFKVYCGDGSTSIPLADLDDAKEWARESNLAYEIANITTQTIVYTSQDQENEEEDQYNADQMADLAYHSQDSEE